MSFSFPCLPTEPDFNLDWDGLDAAFDWIRAMAERPQGPDYHADGCSQIL